MTLRRFRPDRSVQSQARGPAAVARGAPARPGRARLTLNAIIYRSLQEPNNEKTNNGIHYKLQLLYSNGKRDPAGPWPTRPVLLL